MIIRRRLATANAANEISSVNNDQNAVHYDAAGNMTGDWHVHLQVRCLESPDRGAPNERQHSGGYVQVRRQKRTGSKTLGADTTELLLQPAVAGRRGTHAERLGYGGHSIYLGPILHRHTDRPAPGRAGHGHVHASLLHDSYAIRNVTALVKRIRRGGRALLTTIPTAKRPSVTAATRARSGRNAPTTNPPTQTKFATAATPSTPRPATTCRNRYYSVTVATWISTDPLRADINLYRYCGNDPMSRTDPSGLCRDGGSGDGVNAMLCSSPAAMKIRRPTRHLTEREKKDNIRGVSPYHTTAAHAQRDKSDSCAS